VTILGRGLPELCEPRRGRAAGDRLRP
jgi:hypothetical protein